jgi:single-stranded DNA-specific DHH superfamily exonuclease
MQITLDEMIKRVQDAESRMAESPETTAMLKGTADALVDMAKNSKKVTVRTDYDVDGLDSAYIIEKAIKTINPACEVDVRPNDRRGAYGLDEQALQSKDFGKDFGDGLVVLDMGSPQIPLLEQAYGSGAIVIDHHPIKSPETRQTIIDKPNYCNLHVLNPDDDKQNAQYCTAGLAYRIYELAGCKELADEKQNNTVLAMAAIGTAADMVDVLDEHSFNRQILKDGVKVINEATPENFDYTIGYMLSQVKISENTTAHELAFNAGAFLNAGGRMSSSMKENGADRAYKAITAPGDKSSTFREIDFMLSINEQRKQLVNQILSSPEYQEQLMKHKFGEMREQNIAVVILPDNTPHAFAGLVAGRFEEAADKAVLCLTKNTETGAYSGSGRNPESNATSLTEFVEKALGTLDPPLDIKYGGHADALGISQLGENSKDPEKELSRLIEAINDNADLMVRRDVSDTISIAPSEFFAEDAMDKLKALEPTGIGLQLPSVHLSGVETYRNTRLRSAGQNRDDWKRITLNQDGVKLQINDWSYSELAYPQSGKKNNEIEVTAVASINSYGGEHIEFTAKFDRGAFLERAKELGIEPLKTDKEDKTDTAPNLPE